MSVNEKLINDLIFTNKFTSLQSFLDQFECLITQEIRVEHAKPDSVEIFDNFFIKDVKEFCQSKAHLSFGKTLRDIKCVILDKNSREHVVWVHYNGPKNVCITDLDLPHSHLQDQVYDSIEELVNITKKHVGELTNYFEELRQIDQCCTVIEPLRPTFKDNYRKIYLADKIWLHVEVSPEGSAKNLRFVGQFDQRELHEYLQAWDHDKNIATNALIIKSSLNRDEPSETSKAVVPDCAICFCVELREDTKVPEPLCNNSKCGLYFHRSCLYEWFVACANGRMPQFGIGKCPSCFQYIQCTD